MRATTRRSAEPITEPVTAPVSDDADQLRALVSAMLSGTYKEEFYLWDVASLCRAKPDFARQLLALIDRYHRLGQMPAAQHQKIKEKIEQTIASRAAPLSRTATTQNGPAETRARATTTAPLPGSDPAPPVPTNDATPATDHSTAAAGAAAATAGTAAAAAGTAAATAGTAAAGATDASAAQAPDAPDAPTAAAMATAAPLPPAPDHPTAAQVMDALQRMESAMAAPPRPSTLRPKPAPAPDVDTIGPGTMLCNRYELQSLLGSGGMGSVYRALDRYRASLGLPDDCVALKIITAQRPLAANALALVREFHNAQQLSHPNVINVYEIDHQGDASFYTMELLDGERLSQLLERIGGPLSRQHALSVLRDIGAAMTHAHSRSVAHGDLKPHNIFITYGGQVRVLDFGGLSHSPLEPWVRDPAFSRRSNSYRTATPAYASCEQLEGQRADPRDDIYAMACIAYELLAGRHPFDCKSSVEARAQRLRPARPPGMHSEHWRALRHALAWERAQRPAQIGRWLEQVGISTAAGQLPPTHQLTAAEPRRRRIGSAVTAAALLLALGGAVFAIGQRAHVDWHTAASTAGNRLQRTWTAWLSPSDDGAPAPAAAAPRAAAVTPVPAPAASAAPPGDRHRAVIVSAAAPATALAAPAPRRPIVPHRRAAVREKTATLSPAARPTVPVAAAAAVGPASGPVIDAAAAAIGVRFATSSYRVADTAPAARVLIRRTGSTRDPVHFVWWTVEDSAKANVDYAPLGVRTEDIPSGADHITIYIPIISNPLRHQTARFYVALAAPGEARPDRASERAIVTIERGG